VALGGPIFEEVTMTETARERASRNSGITSEMVDVAEGMLRELGISHLSKKFSNRDVLYEVIRAALVVGGSGSVSERADDSLVRDEEGWMQFFEGCRVIVRAPDVGQQLLRLGLESAEAFSALVETIAQNQAIVVPLEKYPGISLFKKHKKAKAPVEGGEEEV